jgi:hypothetical protein
VSASSENQPAGTFYTLFDLLVLVALVGAALISVVEARRAGDGIGIILLSLLAGVVAGVMGRIALVGLTKWLLASSSTASRAWTVRQWITFVVLYVSIIPWVTGLSFFTSRLVRWLVHPAA